MDSKFTYYLPSPIGRLQLEFKGKTLISLHIVEKEEKLEQTLKNKGDIAAPISRLLEQYFSSASSFLSLPLSPHGTDFQRSVWHALCEIPLGETRTYGDIAQQLNSGPRAVGNACRKNPIQIIIPCHRVVSVKDLGGYAGQTEGEQMDIKRWLLAHEGVAL